MIKSVTISSEYGDSFTTNLTEPVMYTVNGGSVGINMTSNIFLTEVEGLGPVKADISMSEITTQHGSVYNSSRAKSRDIIFHFLYLDMNGLTAEGARQRTYSIFPLGRKVTITVKTANRSARTVGYVESNEPEIFTEQAGAAITVNCPSAWFYLTGADGTQSIEFSNLSSEFEFPEVFDSDTGEYVGDLSDEPSPSLIFSAISHKTSTDVYYNGEVETGFTMTLTAMGRFKNPTIYNVVNNQSMRIDTDVIEQFLADNNLDIAFDIITGEEYHTGIYSGDEIRISTVAGNKYVRYYIFSDRTKSYNIISALDIDSDWLTMLPGGNTFGYTCEKIKEKDPVTGKDVWIDTDINVFIDLEIKVYVQGV